MQTGSCHCGRITFTVDANAPTEALECNCSHCQRKGYLLWFQPREQLTYSADEANVGTYLFNKHVIAHKFCKNCGCAPFAIGRKPDGSEMAAINVRCLEGIELDAVARKPINGRAL